jgi:hypothetical protein
VISQFATEEDKVGLLTELGVWKELWPSKGYAPPLTPPARRDDPQVLMARQIRSASSDLSWKGLVAEPYASCSRNVQRP